MRSTPAATHAPSSSYPRPSASTAPSNRSPPRPSPQPGRHALALLGGLLVVVPTGPLPRSIVAASEEATGSDGLREMKQKGNEEDESRGNSANVMAYSTEQMEVVPCAPE
uniref:Uncharacterized protein n=1 Tax=Oryza brachyantha TaxID=4533 RepID=J3LWG2_ORYBR